MCSELRVPGDFDVAQISWRPDYDPFFYRQLSRRARRIYLFRDEYIFDVEKAVVVETPQLGHATYVFAKPRSMDTFLALYTKITKDDIRRNRNNAAERLGFLGRVIHGTNPRAWLKEVRQRIGERIDFAAAMASESRTDSRFHFLWRLTLPAAFAAHAAALPSQSVIGEINLLTIAIPGRSCWTNKFKTVMLQWNSVRESFPGR